MKKIWLVARREFLATVANKGFVLGLLVVPAMMAVAVVVGPRLTTLMSPQVRGAVVVIDHTGRLAADLRSALAAEAIAKRNTERVRDRMEQVLPDRGAGVPIRAMQTAIGNVPQLVIIDRPPTADLQQEKEWLRRSDTDERHLALVVLSPNAVVRASAGGEFGAYDLYVSRGVDEATESVLHEALRQVIVQARLMASNLDPAVIHAATRVTRAEPIVVGAAGEQRTQRAFTRSLPLILGVLMFIGVMLGGQTLMSSTIEEKSSRVIEVLLAAVSPFQLMAGKLLGQMAIGLLVMGLYIGLSLMALSSFAMLGLIQPMLILYLLVFFLITYLVFGGLMIAIGAAVNQVSEAQSLMTPVILLLVLPYGLSPMIGRAPNAPFSVAVSFIPPINTFAMMSRIASDAPPPAWQIWLTVLVGMGAALTTVWFAAKVFRIGLLMHGKPPNLATLVRWARAA